MFYCCNRTAKPGLGTTDIKSCSPNGLIGEMSSNADGTPRVQATPRGQEPAMYLQRPSTGRSQDVRHILARAFRDLYTREAVRPETVKNLQVSKGGDDPYHERYVESLQNVSLILISFF